MQSHRKDVSNALKWVLGTITFLFVSAAVLFPVIARPSHDLYPYVLRHHKDPPLRNGKRPILYASWFRDGNVGRGRDFLVYDDGWTGQFRYWPSGGEGGSTGGSNVELQKLYLLIPLLSTSFSSPNAVPHGQLLIVSVTRHNKWVTLFYDRRNLPVSATKVARIIHATNC